MEGGRIGYNRFNLFMLDYKGIHTLKKRLMILFNTTLVGIIFNFSALDAQIVINEVMSANVNAFAGKGRNFSDWIELANTSSTPVNLSGYYLSDDINNLTKWQFTGTAVQIPANGYLIVYADGNDNSGLSTNFNLSSSGESLFLTRSDGSTEVDRATFGMLPGDVSWARYPDKTGNFQYCLESSPGSRNHSGYEQQVFPPTVSQTSGFYNGPVTITLSHSNSDASIYYTLDGTTPTLQSDRYKSPIRVTESTTLKTRVLQRDYGFSTVQTCTYLIDIESTLPVLSISTDPAGFYDEQTGIYANPDSTGQVWEKRVSLEFFENGQRQFNTDAGIRIQGNSSVVMPKKSFRLIFRSGYGDGRLHYPLFANSLVQSFDNLVLRGGYDEDISTDHGTLLRDPLITELWRRNNRLTSHSRFALLYLNGDFFGIYDIREKVNDTFAKDHLGYHDLDWIRLRYEYWDLEKGSDQTWNDLIDFFADNHFESDAMIEQARSRMEMDNFLWLHAFGHFSQYRSWYYGASAFRETNPDAKWVFTIWDMDRSYTDFEWNGFDYYRDTYGIYWLNLFIHRMLENEQFRFEFINRMMDLKNTAFKPNYVIGILDSLQAEIDFAIPMETDRWGNSYEQWLDNVEAVREFIRERPELVVEQMQNYFDLDDPQTISVQSDLKGTTFDINSIQIDRFPWQGDYFSDIPITITVHAPAGYQFSEWSDSQLPNQETVIVYPKKDMSFNPVFKNADVENEASEKWPVQFRVHSNYPNPFNPATAISFDLPAPARIQLTIYNCLGEIIETKQFKNLFSAGNHSLDFNATRLPGGVYIYQISAVSITGQHWKQAHKMLLLK